MERLPLNCMIILQKDAVDSNSTIIGLVLIHLLDDYNEIIYAVYVKFKHDLFASKCNVLMYAEGEFLEHLVTEDKTQLLSNCRVQFLHEHYCFCVRVWCCKHRVSLLVFILRER